MSVELSACRERIDGEMLPGHSVDLWYPRNEHEGKFIEVGLVDVRAADSILIQYDFERDGYSIMQASQFEWDGDDDITDADWQEVAFVKAWAREKK